MSSLSPSLTEMDEMITESRRLVAALGDPQRDSPDRILAANVVRRAAAAAVKCAEHLYQPATHEGIIAWAYRGWSAEVIDAIGALRGAYLRLIDAMNWRPLLEGVALEFHVPLQVSLRHVEALAASTETLRTRYKSWLAAKIGEPKLSDKRSTAVRLLMPPRKLRQLADMLDYGDTRTVKKILAPFGLRNYPEGNRQSWTFDLNAAPKEIAERFITGANSRRQAQTQAIRAKSS